MAETSVGKSPISQWAYGSIEKMRKNRGDVSGILGMLSKIRFGGWSGQIGGPNDPLTPRGVDVGNTNRSA